MAQPELEAAVDVGGFGYPALAVIRLNDFSKQIYPNKDIST